MKNSFMKLTILIRSFLRGEMWFYVKLLEFLNVDITKSQMECTMTRKEGLYHRSKKKVVGVELFDAKMRQTINDIKERVYKVLTAEDDIQSLSSTIGTNL